MNFLLFVYILYICGVRGKELKGRDLQKLVQKMVKMWSEEIGGKLTELSRSMTREDEVEKSFKPLETKLTKERGEKIALDIALDLTEVMESKTAAVKHIAEYAEFLSYHRRNDPLFANGSYYYFNTDDIQTNELNSTRQEELANAILEDECCWISAKINGNLQNNIFSNPENREKLFEKRKHERGTDCYCLNPNTTQEEEYYFNLPMAYDYRFDDKVNLNLSVVKTATNVYQREQAVLEGVRWSAPLDLVFKNNFVKDPTLTWQYFASPRGFMRHYPAIKWSDETYDRTYDFRTRTWYTEAITSPKDIIILLDRSGSMVGTRRAMSMQIVNQILDTLNDNDFVNVYTFTNTTEPLVDCFNDTLVQANEENLRLLRENLPVYIEEFAADVGLGFLKAFDILENFKSTKTSSNCNQAIMIVTEGVDYDINMTIFKKHNEDQDFPVRIFTYQIGDAVTDAVKLEKLACENMGYWVNMTFMGDIKEKMLNYLNVMSRPINYNPDKKFLQYIWSYLHVDLADRRLSNWLWKKYEGIRQREVFLDHVKRDAFRQKKFFTSDNHMLLFRTHDYKKYETELNYKYMTTVSLPVYGRREDEVELIGVAGVDVPLDIFKAKIPYEKLGVNGYAFIVTNNGYVLIHPDHRTQFKKILKPTFNRVDIVEVEILDDENSPRLFGENIVKFREKLVSQSVSSRISLNVKYSLNEMKRLMLAKRHYFCKPIGPFTLCIVLPDEYGFIKVNNTELKLPKRNVTYNSLLSNSWKAHPDWKYYSNYYKNDTPEEKVRKAFANGEQSNLLHSFFYDLEVTKWFDSDVLDVEDRFTSEYLVHKVFLATRSGLFRWKTLKDVIESDQKSFEDRNSEAIDEDWYKRAVEMNFHDESRFIYSVPFETSGYENNTVITSTKAIFVENGNMKTPVAVVGLQFNHRAMYALYNTTTKKCIDFKEKPCGYTCESSYLNCFILDNNAYVVLSDEPEFIGRYMGDIRPYIMSRLTKENVYIRKRMFDYQAICQKIPPVYDPEKERQRLKEERKAARLRAKSSANKMMMIVDHLVVIKNWFLNLLIILFNLSTSSSWVYESRKPEYQAFNNLAINKTVPTPCDHEMWLYNLNESKGFPYAPFNKATTKFECDWPYVVDRIANTNLLFLAINGDKACTRSDEDHKSPEPQEILYNTNTTTKNALPCYIATMNNYTRRMYMGCLNRDKKEDKLRGNRFYCGHYWD